MNALQINGRVAIRYNEKDIDGKSQTVDYFMTVQEAPKFAGELNSAIKIVSEMSGMRDGVFVGTD